MTYTKMGYCELECTIPIPPEYEKISNDCDDNISLSFGKYIHTLCGCLDLTSGKAPLYGLPNPDYTPPKPPTPDECRSEVGSYVIPKTRTFHEDIPLAGSDVTLHYSSRHAVDTNRSSIGAQGWSLSVHHRLVGNTLYKGDGSVLENVNRSNNIITDGALHYYVDANNLHVKTRNALTHTDLYTFTYNSANQLTTVTNSDGRQLHLAYDSRGIVKHLTTDTAAQTLLEITNRLLHRLTYEEGAAYQFSYDSRGLMLQESEPNGNLFTHLFDSSGKVTHVHDAEGGIFAYETSHTLQYDESIIRYPENETVTYRNYAPNNGFSRSSVTYANGDVVTTQVADDHQTILTEACGTTTKRDYNTTHPITQEPLLSSLSITTPSGLTYTSAYRYSIDASRYRHTEVHNHHRRTYTIDYTNHTIEITTAEGHKHTLYYDDTMQHLLQSNSAGALPTLYTYDTNGRVTQMRQGQRQRVYTYDARGNLTAVHDTNATAPYRYSYDTRDRLSTITRPDGSRISFNYDANGNITQLHTPQGSTNTFTYNGVNKESSWQSPLGYTTQYRYDKQRRLTQIVRPSGKTETLTYTQGELTQITTDETTLNMTYGCGSRLQRINTTEGEQLSYSYDGDLLTSINASGTLNERIDLTYNNSFLPQRITYADATETLAYDGDGRLTQSGDATLHYSPTETIVTEGQYRSAYRLNGYTQLQQITSSYEATPRYSYSVTARNAQGKITESVERLGNRTLQHHYRYDNNGRLIEAEQRSATVVVIPFDGLIIPLLTDQESYKEHYTYDAEGNRIEQRITHNGTLISKTASYTLDNALESIGDTFYTYDEDGYLTSQTDGTQTTTYSYGTQGELRHVVTPTQSIEYLHNATNQRVAKKINGEIVEKYLWLNRTTLLATYDKDDKLITRYSYAGNRVPYKMTHHNQSYYLLYNHLGSLRAVIDSNGTIVKEVTYDSFGKILSDSNPNLHVNLGFAGGLYDPDTQLTRFGYRDYDAQTGKWTAKDPIRFNGGDVNLYGYVLGDPVNFVDPEGLTAFLAIPLALLLADSYLNAPETQNDVYDDLTPSNKFGLCLVGGKYYKNNKHQPHNEFGPHLHWGPKKYQHLKAPGKYHFGPKNPNHGLPKGQSKWGGWKDWWDKGRPWGWK